MTIPLSIYLHIPFCRSKCTYCAFNTYIKLESLIPEFVTALIHEVECVGQKQPAHSVFLGGGTPSMLSPTQLGSILAAVDRCFDLLPGTEISLEANPNDLEAAYLHELRRLGINRLSLGVQSTHQHELRLFARRHNNDEVAASVSAARRAGFKSLNIDLIYGAPHQTLERWSWTLRHIVDLGPDHLSLYALGLEEGTPMYDWVQQGSLPTPDDDLAADMYDMASERLAKAGYEQYEISNWAKPGHQCRHNLQYWRNWPYIGLGPGAHGYAAGKRYWTVRPPQQYIDCLSDKGIESTFPLSPAVDDYVDIGREDEIGETLMMGLRLTQEGIGRKDFEARFGADVATLYAAAIDRLVGQGLLEIDAQRLKLTSRGRFLSNAVLREFI